MDNLLIYLAKSALILGLFHAIYLFLLEKETFHRHKRVYLLSGILVSLLLPLFGYTQIIWLDQTPVMTGIPISATRSTPDQPVFWQLSHILTAIYFIGITFFAARLGISMINLRQILSSGKLIKDGVFIHIRHNRQVPPFSFFSFLVYNPANFSEDEQSMIISHEKVHARQWHSLDILAARLFCIFQWWNPLAWLYDKSIKTNLEFIADQGTAPANMRNYQYLLLRHSLPNQYLSLVNPIFSSSIKKRISMLQKRSSHPGRQWKFILILPFLGAFFLFFNVKTIAQVKVEMTNTTIEEERIVVAIDKNASDENLQKEAKIFEEYGISLVFENIQRNDAGEIIGIASSYTDKDGASGQYSAVSQDPIETFTFYVSITEGKKRMGYGKTEMLGRTPRMKFSAKENEMFIFEADSIQMEGKKFIFFSEDEVVRGDSMTLTIEIDEDFEGGKKMITNGPGGKHIVIIKDEEMPEGMKWIQKEGDELEITEVETVIESTKGKDGEKTIKIVTKTEDKDEQRVVIKEKNEEKVVRFNTEASDDKPLFVIDGEEKGADFDMASINPDDIESINVWKGEKAIEKYGEKAKNGVIEVTTKKK